MLVVAILPRRLLSERPRRGELLSIVASGLEVRKTTDADKKSSAHRAVRKTRSAKWYMGERVKKEEAGHCLGTV